MTANAGLGRTQSCCHNTPEGKQATHRSPLHRLICGLISGSTFQGVQARGRMPPLQGSCPFQATLLWRRTVSLTPSQGLAVLQAQVATHPHRSKRPRQRQNPRGERTGFRKSTPETGDGISSTSVNSSFRIEFWLEGHGHGSTLYLR